MIFFKINLDKKELFRIMATVTKPILLDETGQAILSKLNEVSILPQIVDNCTTAAANKALSANQGKQLLDTINGTTNYIARGNVSSGNVNNLTSCGTYNCDNCTNSPYTYAKIVVESDASGSWIKQTATNILSPYQSCYRIKNGSEPWSAWIGGYETGTISTDFTMQSAFELYKVGNIVSFFFYISLNTTITNNTPLAYFSVGFRPPQSIHLPGMYLGGSEDGCNAFFRLDPSGVLYQDYALSINADRIAVEGSFPVLA